jgi:hypothetical protein
MPRGLISHFDDLRNTSVVTMHHLGFLPRIEPKKDKSDKMSVAKKKMTSATVSSNALNVGSVSGHHFTEETLAGLQPGGCYCDLAESLLNNHTLSARDHAIYTYDLAVLLMVLEFCTQNPNPDGSMPTARVNGLWDALYKSRAICRGWDNGRYAAMRNFLSGLGALDWTDEDYVVGRLEYGHWKKGVAAKWCLSAETMQTLADYRRWDEQCNEEENTLASFMSSGIINFVRALRMCSWGETIKPVEALVPRLYGWSPEELTSLIPDYEMQMAA